jgi:hypothetical protein
MATKTATAEAPKAAPDVVRISTRTADEMAQMAASTVGAQVILDYNGAGSLGARGGAGATIEENTAARDVHLTALGFDPTAPSGPPTVPDPEAATASAEAAAGLVRGRATKISSLAAGILSGANVPDGSVPPVNTAVPAVSQSGATLLCTMGTWDGEPTAYAYQWQFDGADVASDGETCPVVTADAGKMATCVVSATNAAGTTAAPPSVGVTITDPGAAGTRRGK